MPKDSLFPNDEPVGFQVWHKQGQRYAYVASVESNALGAIMMTTHGFLGYQRWPDNPAVSAAPGDHRSTDIGDVLIGRDGRSLEIAADDGLHLKPIAPVAGVPVDGMGAPAEPDRAAHAKEPPAEAKAGKDAVVWADDSLFQDWTVPPPPTRERVEVQIRQLKAGTEWSTIVELDIGRDETLSGRSWGDLTEAQKLDQLRLGTDVMLLDPQERHELLAREVDFARIVPTREQIETTIGRIKVLIGTTYMEGQEYDAGDQHPPRSGLEPIPFNALTRGDRIELLDMVVDWEGFTDAQRGSVKRRVLEGRGAESWMDGIGPAEPSRPLRPGSEETPLERVERELRDWKTDHASFWNEACNEAGRLRVLEGELDWTGVAARDKQAIIAREVDFRKITPEELEAAYQPSVMAAGWVIAVTPDHAPSPPGDAEIRVEPGKIGYLSGYLGGPWSDVDRDTEFRVTHVEITAPGRKLSPGEWKDVLQGLRQHLPEVAELIDGNRGGEGGDLSPAYEKLVPLPPPEAAGKPSPAELVERAGPPSPRLTGGQTHKPKL
jgi:hypothetical protein